MGFGMLRRSRHDYGLDFSIVDTTLAGELSGPATVDHMFIHWGVPRALEDTTESRALLRRACPDAFFSKLLSRALVERASEAPSRRL